MQLSRKLIPSIDNLLAFESAARFESFTQAAKELCLTQSAVSRQIKDLESQIGVRLFERIRQRVVLSHAGRRFLPEVRRILEQSEDLMMRAMAASQSASSLSIATLPTFGTRWLLPRLSNFLELCPGTSINVGARSHPFDFSEQPFDLAVHYGPPIWPRATCKVLCREIVVPAGSPRMLEQHRPRDIADVASLPLLHVATRPKAWSQWFDQAGVEQRAPYRGHRFDLFAMVIEAAVSGLGVALLPIYLIEKELLCGSLVRVIDHPVASEHCYYLVVPDDKKNNPTIDCFIDWALKQIAQSGELWTRFDTG